MSRNLFNGRKSAPENKSSNFAQTCNLLSHYFKEKGSKTCLEDLNHLGIISGKLELSERPETSAAAAAAADTTSMDQLLKGDADESGQISTQNVLFPRYAPNTVAYATVQDAINNTSSSSVGERAATQPKTAQLTIFYAGQVLVFDDISAARAKEVMLLASKGASTTGFDSSSTTNINKIVDNPMPSSSYNLPNSGSFQVESETQPQSHPIASDLPIARRASLHRFLEKRKDRTTARAPYQLHNPSPESPKELFDLNL